MEEMKKYVETMEAVYQTLTESDKKMYIACYLNDKKIYWDATFDKKHYESPEYEDCIIFDTFDAQMFDKKTFIKYALDVILLEF